MLKVMDLKCTNCGAVLDVWNEKMRATCPYCGSNYVLDEHRKNAKSSSVSSGNMLEEQKEYRIIKELSKKLCIAPLKFSAGDDREDITKGLLCGFSTDSFGLWGSVDGMSPEDITDSVAFISGVSYRLKKNYDVSVRIGKYEESVEKYIGKDYISFFGGEKKIKWIVEKNAFAWNKKSFMEGRRRVKGHLEKSKAILASYGFDISERESENERFYGKEKTIEHYINFDGHKIVSPSDMGRSFSNYIELMERIESSDAFKAIAAKYCKYIAGTFYVSSKYVGFGSPKRSDKSTFMRYNMSPLPDGDMIMAFAIALASKIIENSKGALDIGGLDASDRSDEKLYFGPLYEGVLLDKGEKEFLFRTRNTARKEQALKSW